MTHLDEQAALAWLGGKARELLAQAREEWPSGIVCYYPAAGGHTYTAFYLRDFTYMVESAPEFMPAEDVRKGVEAFLDGVYQDGSVPQTIGRDGQYNYFCHGARVPVADSYMFLIKLVDAYTRGYGDDRFVHSHFAVLDRVMAAIPRDPSGGSLVWIDPRRPYTSYGFQDTVAKSGYDLFCSLLLHEACGKMASFARRVGAAGAAERYMGEMRRIENDLEILYAEREALYYAASEQCRQVDIWGSIYGCALGIFPEQRRQQVAQALWDRRGNYLYRSQVRHLLLPEYWQELFTLNIRYAEFLAPNTFQNGAYWAMSTGWLAEVFEALEPGRGVKLLCQLAADLQEHGVWECIGPGGYCHVPGNLSSIVVPYGSMKKLVGGP